MWKLCIYRNYVVQKNSVVSSRIVAPFSLKKIFPVNSEAVCYMRIGGFQIQP